MAGLTPEVVVGGLLGVIVGSLVTEQQKIALPGGTYGGAAIGGILGGIAGRALFGAEEAPAQAPAAPVQQQQAAPAPQVIVVNPVQQAAPAPAPTRVVYREGAPHLQGDEPGERGFTGPEAPADRAARYGYELPPEGYQPSEYGHGPGASGYQQYGQPVIIGRPRSGQVSRGDVRDARRERRVERFREEPAPRQRMTLAEMERVARTGQRLLAEHLPEDLMPEELEEVFVRRGEREEEREEPVAGYGRADRSGRIVVGRLGRF